MNPFLLLEMPWPFMGNDEDVPETEVVEGEE